MRAWSSDCRMLIAAVLLSGLLPLRPAHAEWGFEFESPTNLFLDRSYLFYSPNKIHRTGDPRTPVPLLFEAQVAPNLFFPQLHTGKFTDPNGEFIFSAVLTPLIRLRMLGTDSNPVIPPSFMPKLTLQLANMRMISSRQTPGGSEGQTPPIQDGYAVAAAVNFIVGHHSNGQSGCLFSNQEGTDPDCSPQPGELPLNELNGNFSTNYVRVELHSRVGTGIDYAKRSAWVFGGSLSLELNLSVGPGGISREQRELFGDGRVNIELEGLRTWYEHRFRLTGVLSPPLGGKIDQRTTLSAEMAVIPRWGAGFGVFTRYIHGQDYYNILFLQRVSLWQFGLIFELSPGKRFLRPEQE